MLADIQNTLSITTLTSSLIHHATTKKEMKLYSDRTRYFIICFPHYWSHYPGVSVSSTSDGLRHQEAHHAAPISSNLRNSILRLSLKLGFYKALSFSSQFIFVAHNNKVNDVKIFFLALSLSSAQQGSIANVVQSTLKFRL